MCAEQMSRAERVRLAVRKFKLERKKVEAALDWIDAELKKRDRERNHHLWGNKAARQHVRMLRDAARKTLAYTKSDKLPQTLWAAFTLSEIPGMLQALHDTCDLVLSNKLTPKRDDGHEKRLAVEQAILLLPGHAKSMTSIPELAAVLYGITSALDLRRAWRRFNEKAPLDPQSPHDVIRQLSIELWRANSRPKPLGKRTHPGAK
jgi:hypothetical protein